MKAGIIDNQSRSEFWDDLLGDSFDCVVAADISKLPDCDIILVSEEYSGGSIDTLIGNIRESERFGEVPSAIVVNGSKSCDEQEKLLSLGFDDIICLPLCKQLLKRRAKSLMFVNGSNDKMITLENLIDTKDGNEGAYCVRSGEFNNIFRFVLRVLERTGKDAQILVLTLSSDEKHSISSQESGMTTLSEAVRMCLRRGDMSSVCGDDKILVLLIGADDEGGHLVASRIVSSFYSECTDDSYEITYDIKEVKAAE